ncbi:Ntn hydrolase family protein [Cesiribacter andamanensis]|uniref:Uncharacterized protein n=1 Tax=Cesiribacter andamanensis AMV16 TaxID=1279009 RepID=M7N463_9BACT|nr:hypothetical protein [Cesiribacter andamanensis]EMR03463.1 hypothetical protein ADICEAN_01396 [Cesiribacter andamanensis AMV16]
MKKLLLLPLLFISFLLQAQNFNIPAYKTKEDYAIHEAQVLQAIEWLRTAPLSHASRPQANAYVLKWAEGSPTVSVVVNSYVMGLAEQNPDFLMLWIGGWIEYALQNKETYSEAEANHQAVKAVIAYYMAGNDVKKDPKLDKLVKQHQKGKLQAWVAKQY